MRMSDRASIFQRSRSGNTSSLWPAGRPAFPSESAARRRVTLDCRGWRSSGWEPSLALESLTGLATGSRRTGRPSERADWGLVFEQIYGAESRVSWVPRGYSRGIVARQNARHERRGKESMG